MPADHLTDLGLSCPDGGDFYVCGGNSTEFIGCCTSDPCSDGAGDCPTRNLRASSFSPDRYANIPAQSCDDNRRENVWYTCADNSPPFLGCCASNPCGDGCPRDHLIAAVLSDDDVDRLAFLEPNSTSPSTSATSTPSTTPTSSPSSAPEPSSSGLGTGAIAGIAVAGAAALLIIIALLWFCRRRALKKRAQQTPMTYHGSMPTSPAYPGMRDSHMSAATTAIPHSYHTTPTSPDFPKTYAHYAHQHQHQHQHQQQYPSSPPPHSVYSQFTDGEGGGYHARHVSQMSGVSGMTEQQQHQALFPVSEIDGVEREAPRVELPATEVSTKRKGVKGVGL